MMRERIYEDLTLILRRTRIVFYICAALCVFLLFYYWKVQILDHDKYWKLGEANRTRVRVMTAPRGLIRDREGGILAENTVGFRVSLDRENTPDLAASVAAMSRLLELDPEVLRERLAKTGDRTAFQPVVVKDNLTLEEVSRLESRRLELPEVIVEAEPKRAYPRHRFATHVLGYLQIMAPEDLQSPLGKRHRPSDMAGRTGIERQYDAILTGTDGTLYEVVDSLGRSRGEISRREPVQGRDLWLAMDSELQQKAEELLGDREGAIVVLDTRTGELLTLASFPTYDPNGFISRFTPQEWVDLTTDPTFPLENRAIRGLYSPGSIFKMVMALGGLDAGAVGPGTTFYCAGSTVIYGNPFGCWLASGHGPMNLSDAIKNSCNIYFYQVGRRLGIDQIANYAQLAGLGRKTGLDLPGEKDGLVPSTEWKLRTANAPWFPGETISVAIGQGPLLVTPLQIACLTAFVARRGVPVTPRLARADGPPPAPDRVAVPASVFERVVEGMWRSVNDGGTGHAAAVAGFDICGKTGSTQVISRERAAQLAQQGREVKTHSWFSGFAPRGEPRVAVTVLVEYGGGGGALAAVLAHDLFELYARKYAR